MEGPRMVKPREWESLRQMLDIVFWPTLLEKYPLLFNKDNRENLRVFVDRGRVVSHIGFIERGASILGCQLKVACLGAVSTLPDYRKRGLATQLFEDALAKMEVDGVDVLLISGDRPLYRRYGCARVGHYYSLRITKKDLRRLPRHPLELRKLSPAEVPQVAELYRREPVRFLRPREDYHYFLQCHWAMNRLSELFTIRQAGRILAYVVLQLPREKPEEAGKANLAEFAGARELVLAALPELFKRYALTELGLRFQATDPSVLALLSPRQLVAGAAPGTVIIINFRQTMQRLRPHYEEALGGNLAPRLSFRERKGRRRTEEGGSVFNISCGKEAMKLSGRAEVGRLLFGSQEPGTPAPPPTLKKLFPLPALWYGLNYV